MPWQLLRKCGGREPLLKIIRFCIDQDGSQGYRAIRVDIVPDNYPARTLFEKNGFTWAGDADLKLNIGNIPVLSLYELNL